MSKYLLKLVNGIQNARGRAYPKINPEQCIGCGQCKKICHHDAIAGASKQAHTIAVAKCFRCYHCVEKCPKAAIRIK